MDAQCKTQSEPQPLESKPSVQDGMKGVPVTTSRMCGDSSPEPQRSCEAKLCAKEKCETCHVPSEWIRRWCQAKPKERQSVDPIGCDPKHTRPQCGHSSSLQPPCVPVDTQGCPSKLGVRPGRAGATTGSGWVWATLLILKGTLKQTHVQVEGVACRRDGDRVCARPETLDTRPGPRRQTRVSHHPCDDRSEIRADQRETFPSLGSSQDRPCVHEQGVC